MHLSIYSFAMHRITSTWILSPLVLLIYTSTTQIATGSSDHDDFFDKCRPSTCSKDGPQVRFPYRLSTSPSPCGAVGMSLSCLGNDTILQLPNVGSCKVLDINYKSGYITVELGEAFSFCAYEKLSSINFTSAVYGVLSPYSENKNLISCTDPVNKSSYTFNSYDGPVPCLSNASQLMYFIDGGGFIGGIPSFCTVLQNNTTFPISYSSMNEIGSKSNDSVYVSLTWSVPGITERCIKCEIAWKHCAGTDIFCPHHSQNVKILAISSTVLIMLLFLVAVLRYNCRRLSRKEHLRQEELLAMYSKTATRYTFSEIKKMTKRFKDKLGQGGYGSVFKGELPNGIHVAVKVLERSNTNSNNRDFINEVATIGTIHHFNVVRLLGFSSEGSKCALVYEYMPNGSLDKYISRKSLCNAGEMPQIEIFFKIASGIKYLHEGCIQRILHFDIKPHNFVGSPLKPQNC